MKEEEFLKIVEESFKRRREIFSKKSKDYATEDVFSNFKRIAKMMEILGIDPTLPHGVACIYILLKMDRFCNLTFRKKGSKPQNESIQDTIDDWKNYLDLLEGIYIEYVNSKSPTKQQDLASSSRDGLEG